MILYSRVVSEPGLLIEFNGFFKNSYKTWHHRSNIFNRVTAVESSQMVMYTINMIQQILIFQVSVSL